jgi:hypothetical protein
VFLFYFKTFIKNGERNSLSLCAFFFRTVLGLLSPQIINGHHHENRAHSETIGTGLTFNITTAGERVLLPPLVFKASMGSVLR